MKRAVVILLCLFSCKATTPQVSVELVRVGQTIIETSAGAKIFSLEFTAGSLVIDQLNLVDFEANEETALLAAPLTFDFFTEARLPIAPVLVIPAEYEQIHMIPNNEVVTIAMLFTVTLSDDTTTAGELSLQLPFVDEQQIDALLDIQENDQKKIVLAFDPAKIFNGVDFDLLAVNGAAVTLDANNPDPLVSTAVDLIVENVFASFALVSAQ
jgi:hypothetical protein